MKKIISIISCLAIMATMFIILPVQTTAVTSPNWDVTGTWVWLVLGTYAHDMVLTQNPDGTFSGTGGYPAGTYPYDDPGQTSEIITNGLVDGDTVTFTTTYLGPYNPGYTVTVSGTIAPDGTMSGTSPWEWHTTSGSATFNRYAEIVEPEEDEVIFGNLYLEAYLVDNDEDYVDWAVREGTCTAGTNTVLGNVDGHSDSLTMAQDGYTYTYTGSFDVTGFDAGMYCFIFNPREDAGEDNIRLTREFYLNIDDDNDGVLDVNDKCLGTVADEPEVALGTNRHVWYEGEYFTTLVPAGKGSFDEVGSAFSIEDTYGCSCEQILDGMSETTGLDFEGHYKFGCSKSILEDWHEGIYYVDPFVVETVEVPANDADGVLSVMNPELGKNYTLKAYGTGMACDSGSCHITFDAEYSASDYPDFLNWVDGVAAPYNGYGENLLDLKVDDGFVDWDDDSIYNSDHTYYLDYIGTGAQLALGVYDLAGSYFNNTGSLWVDIIKDWIDLW